MSRFSKADARSLLLAGEDLVVRFAVKREESFDNAGSRLSLSMDGKAIEIEGVALHVIPGRMSSNRQAVGGSRRNRPV